MEGREREMECGCRGGKCRKDIEMQQEKDGCKDEGLCEREQRL